MILFQVLGVAMFSSCSCLIVVFSRQTVSTTTFEFLRAFLDLVFQSLIILDSLYVMILAD